MYAFMDKNNCLILQGKQLSYQKVLPILTYDKNLFVCSFLICLLSYDSKYKLEEERESLTKKENILKSERSQLRERRKKW